MDWVALALIGGGVLFLALWRDSANADRKTLTQSITPELAMNKDDDESPPARPATTLPARLTSSLPQKLDSRLIEQRVAENLAVFQNTEGLFDAFLINLRDRYRSRWELEMLDRIEQKLERQVRVMELGSHHDAVRRTLQQRTDTEIMRTQVDHSKAQQELEAVRASGLASQELSKMEADNRLLEERIRNQELKRKLDAVKQPEKRAEPDDPRLKRSFADKQKEELRRMVEEAEARINGLLEFNRFVDEVTARCAAANLTPGNDAYEHIMNMLDGIRERLTK